MAKVTRSSHKLKDDDSNNSKRTATGGKGSTTSESMTTDTSSLRRSTRETSLKKQSESSLSPTRKSERIERRAPQTPPTTRKSERVENRRMPSPLRRSGRSEKQHSLDISGSKNSSKTSSSPITKRNKEKKGKSVEKMKVNDEDGTRNKKKALKPVKIISKKKRLDARSYRAFLKPQERKAKESDPGQTLKGQEGIAETVSENTGDIGSKEVEDDEGDCSEENEEEVRQKDVGQGSQRDIHGESGDTGPSKSEEVEDGSEFNEGKNDEIRVKDLGEGRKRATEGDIGSKEVEVEVEGECSELKREVRREEDREGCKIANDGSISGSRKSVQETLIDNGEVEISYFSRKRKNDPEESFKRSKNRDSPPFCKKRSSCSESSPPAVEAKEAIEDCGMMQVDCSKRRDLQKKESTGSPSAGKQPSGDHDFERGEKAGASTRKHPDMESTASATEDSEEVCISTSQSGSMEAKRTERCFSCSKRRRVDFNSKNHGTCSCHSGKNQDVCNTSSLKAVREQEFNVTTPQTGEMLVDGTQKDGTLTEEAVHIDEIEVVSHAERNVAQDQTDSPARIDIPICQEQDERDLEAGVCRRSAEECCISVQLKDSSLEIQAGDDQNACIVCKLGGKILCCDGKGCKNSYHLDCLEPTLKDVPVGVWHCVSCTKKKMESGAYSVSRGVESICDYKEIKLPDGGIQKQYLVKYQDVAHVHNRWISESQLLHDAKDLVAKFKINEAGRWKKEWTVPHRLLQRRLNPNSQYEWFVKWSGLGYEHATWELETELSTLSEFRTLEDNYENRLKKAKLGAAPSRADKVLNEKSGPFCKLSKLPGQPGLHSEYLCFINNLRERWHKGQNTVIMEDQEKVIKVILFILSMQSSICRPFLIISTVSSLYAWEAEFMRLVPSINVVVYSGSKDDRKTIRTLEFYEEGGCIMFEVLLSHPDAIIEDLEVVECVGWEAVIVDECHLSCVSKHLEQIKMLPTDFKLLLFGGPVKDTTAEYLNLLAFIDSRVEGGGTDNSKIVSTDNSGKLKEQFAQFVVSGRKSHFKFVEYWVPVRLSNVQLEQYCHTLLSNSMSLRSLSKTDPVGALRDILISTRKCCDHPYIVDPSLQSLITKGLPAVEYLDVGVSASGKLQVLDKFLSEILKRGLRALILFQRIGGSARMSIGDILDDFLRQRFGPDSYERVDSGLLTSKKQTAMNMFNNKERGRFVFLIENRACLPSIKLSSVDVVVLFDSDWNPLNDLRALQRISIETEFEKLKVFRLYSPCTLEEKALILAKQDMSLDSNVQNINCTISHTLLRWGASYLFKMLDEFHASPPSSSSIISSEQSLLKNVLLDLFAHLPKDVGNTRDCSIISEVRLCGLTYSSDNSLLGELEIQSSDEELPNIFWTRLLERKCPQWRYLSETSQRVRRKVQYFDAQPEKTDGDNDDTAKKRKKVVNSTTDPVSLKSSAEDKKKGVNVNNKGASEIPACNSSQPMTKSTCGLDAVSTPNAISVTEARATEYEERRHLCDSQNSLHLILKPEISRLCEILQLPEDVKVVTGKFLEYIMHNHQVNREPATILQAFQISVCWTAASLLKQKMNRKETLNLARQHLNFECRDEEAESVYSILRKMKKMFSRQAESTMRFNVAEDSARTKDVAEDSARTKDVAEDSARTKDVAEPLVHPMAFQSAGCNQQSLEGEVRESSQSQHSSNERIHPIQEEATNREKVNESPKIDPSNSISLAKRIHSKRMRHLIQKQMEEFEEFNENRKTIMEKTKAELENKHKLEKALICAIHIQGSVRSDKLKTEEQNFEKKIEELNSHWDAQQKKLEAMQLAARTDEKRIYSHWVEEAKCGRPVGSFSMLRLPGCEFRLDELESTEQVELRSGPEKAIPISRPSEKLNADGKAADTVVPDGEPVAVVEVPKIIHNEALGAVATTAPLDVAVQSTEENNFAVEETIMNPSEGGEFVPPEVVEQQHGNGNIAVSGSDSILGSPSMEQTRLNSPLAQQQTSRVQDNLVTSSQMHPNEESQREDIPSCEVQNSSLEVEVPLFQSSESLPSEQPFDSSHSGRPAFAVNECSGNNQTLATSDQSQPPTQASVEEQDELVNHSIPQPEAQHPTEASAEAEQAELNHSIPQLEAQCPTQASAEVEQAELFSHCIPQSEIQLECDRTLRHTPSQQAQDATQPTACEISAQPQSELFDNSIPHHEVQLERSHLLRHSSPQQAQLQTQSPAEVYAELHGVLQSNTQSQLHVSTERPAIAGGSRMLDSRSIGVMESNTRPPQNAPVTPRASQPFLPDPLQNELTRIHKEEDQMTKFHEDLTLRINSECEKEMEEIRRKYNTMRQDTETAFAQKKKALETVKNKVYMNRILAEVFRFKCSEPRASGALGSQQGAPAGFMQQLLQMSSLHNRPVAATVSPAAPPPAPPIQVVRHSSALFSGNPVRPHINSVGPPTGNYQVSGEMRVPAPHLQPFRTSTSMSPHNHHSPSSQIPSQQAVSNPVIPATTPIPHHLPVRPTYASGSHGRTNQSDSAGVSVGSRNAPPMQEPPRNIENRSIANPPNMFAPVQYLRPNTDSYNLSEPATNGTLPVPATGADVVCLSDDD